MGVTERKEREKAERRALIMRCAKELILEQGGEKASLRDIARKAELSKGTLYLYFPGKKALFQEICNESALSFIEYFQSRRFPEASALEALKLYWSCFLELYGKRSDLLMLFHLRRYMIPNYPFISREDREGSDSNPSFIIFTMIRTIIEQGIGEGLFNPTINPALITHTILSIFSILLENPEVWRAESGEGRVVEEMRSVFEILLKGIASDTVDRAALILGASI